MNSINRLEETWTPKWDLGMQDEFGFSVEESAEDAAAFLTERPKAWAEARGAARGGEDRPGGLSDDAEKRKKLVRFLEALSAEISGDE